MLDADVHLEELISKRELTDEERRLQYMACMRFEQTTGEPARVQIVYEHAITEFPASADFWLIYTEYLYRRIFVCALTIGGCSWDITTALRKTVRVYP